MVPVKVTAKLAPLLTEVGLMLVTEGLFVARWEILLGKGIVPVIQAWGGDAEHTDRIAA